MLRQAHDLETESLGRTRGGLWRGRENVRPLVIVKELRDRYDAVAAPRILFDGRERALERRELWNVVGHAAARRDVARDASQYRGGRREQRFLLRARDVDSA